MIKFLTETESLYNSLNSEYREAKEKGILLTRTPSAFVSFIIIRLTCEFEACIHKIVKDKLKAETTSKRLHNFIDNQVRLRSSKSTEINNNLKSFNMSIDTQILFPNNQEREKFYYNKIFGTNQNKIGPENLRNQIAHLQGFDFTNLPNFEEILKYIETCDSVLERIEKNIKFSK